MTDAVECATRPAVSKCVLAMTGTRLITPFHVFESISKSPTPREEMSLVRIKNSTEERKHEVIGHGMLNPRTVMVRCQKRKHQWIIFSNMLILERILHLLPTANTIEDYFGKHFLDEIDSFAHNSDTGNDDEIMTIVKRFFKDRGVDSGVFVKLAAFMESHAKYADDLHTDPFVWSSTLTADTITIETNHHANSYEMNRIVLFLEKCIVRFGWPSILSKTEDTVSYPRAYAEAIYMMPLALSISRYYRNCFLYSTTLKVFRHDAAVLSSLVGFLVLNPDARTDHCGQLQLVVLMMLSLATFPFTFRFSRERRLARKRLRIVILNDDSTLLYNNKSRLKMLRHYPMASFPEEELIAKLRFMYFALKEPFLRIVRRLGDTKTDFDFGERGNDWMLHTFFCVTLFDPRQDRNSLLYNSIFLRPYLNYEVAYHFYRIISEHHSMNPRYSALLTKLDPFINLIKTPHLLDPQELVHPLEVVHESYGVIALLFQFAYEVQAGILPIPPHEMPHIRKLYLDGVNLEIEMEMLPPSPKKGDTPDFFLKKHLAAIEGKYMGDDAIFGLMMRFIECMACQACRSGYRNCVHYSAPVSPLRTFSEVMLLRNPDVSNHFGSIMSCPHLLHVLFDGANDFALRHEVVATMQPPIESMLPNAF